MKVLQRISLVISLVLAALLLLLSLLWSALWIARAIVYRDYITNKEAVATIPALSDGFVPQGITYDESSDTYIFSGFRGKDALIAVNHGNGDMRLLSLLDPSGAPLHGHAGGIEQAGQLVYLACNHVVTVFSLSTLLAAPDASTVPSLAEIPVDTAASFCFSDGASLFVGEFYRAKDYEVDLSHAYTTPEGEKHRALVSCYPLLPDGSFADAYPSYSISLPAQVQGFAIHGNTLMTSCSWGIASSTLSFYEGMLDSGRTIDVSGKEVPLYYIGEKNLKKTLSMPAFSEELCVVDNRVIVNFESASNKYIVGKFFFADQAISYPIPQFVKK